MFFQVLSSGIAQGCIYGLVALSFVLIYKATGTVSFMQGALLTVGAFLALALERAVGLPFAIAAPAAILLLVALGALLERLALRRALGQPHLTAVLLTFGLALVLRGAIVSVPAASQTTQRLELPFDLSFDLGGVHVAGEQVAVVLGTLAITLLGSLFFRHTRVGLALRACAEDARVASLMGVSVEAMHTLAWGLGAGLACCAGLLMAPTSFVHAEMGQVALKAFPAAVLGGMTSLPGALAGGVLLGVVEALAGLGLPEGFKDVAAYLILMLTLLVFPQGLAGGRTR